MVLVLGLDRGVHVELFVESGVVARPHVLEGGGLDLLDGAPWSSAADQRRCRMAVMLGPTGRSTTPLVRTVPM